MKIPSDVGFQYKDESGAWKDATLVSHPKNFSKFNQYNQITIGEITTKTIRMNMKVTEIPAVFTVGKSMQIYRILLVSAMQ